eukprot:CAMPEP_0181505134 /NCGR_PEP_ID=MMETSP1110-20121109/57894_1 /TAXON_ID=174948 /ORGANISM="Symbiodinium sp., Strain CCMP421" /LENGTH=323 /DNA_ID=CAMNT_0023634095 /DNA_START=85 /DNA_END=1054 /DNA_ORIENTATION=-
MGDGHDGLGRGAAAPGQPHPLRRVHGGHDPDGFGAAWGEALAAARGGADQLWPSPMCHAQLHGRLKLAGPGFGLHPGWSDAAVGPPDPSPAVLQSLIAQANRVAFVGDHLVTGGSSGKVCVWNHRKQQVEREIAPNTGEELRNGESHKRRRLDGNKVATTFSQVGRISSLCGSPDGRLLACGRDSGHIGLLQLDNMQWASPDLQAHMQTGAVRSLSFDESSRFLLSGGDDRNICLMDVAHWAHRGRRPSLERFPGHRARITSVSFCPDVRRAVAVSSAWDGVVKLWDYRTQRLLQSFSEHKGCVMDTAFAPSDGRFFVTVGAD